MNIIRLSYIDLNNGVSVFLITCAEFYNYLLFTFCSKTYSFIFNFIWNILVLHSMEV